MATVLVGAVLALGVVGAAYHITAAFLVRRFAGAAPGSGGRAPTALPGVTVLKPLYGEEPELYERLRSNCEQDFPGPFQIVFGVREAADPAVGVVRRLIAERPDLDLELVIDPRVGGSNLKIANLENMLPRARHDVLVIADSDMHVGRDYLATVTRPLLDPAIGLVTCLYRGRPVGGGLAARFGALWVNHGFLPSAVVNERLGPGKACFGATMALRRATLEAIGGLQVLRNQLADDWMLGDAVRRSGRRIVLSPCLVDTTVGEQDLAALFRHELRWTRTIRGIAPVGYAASVVTHAIPLALLGTGLAAALAPALLPGAAGALLFAALARLGAVRVLDRALGLSPTQAWLVPVRDLLSFLVFVASFAGNRVNWRNRRFRVDAEGRMVADGDLSA